MDPGVLAQRQYRRYHMHGRMATGESVALVHFQKCACCTVEQGGRFGMNLLTCADECGATAQAHDRIEPLHLRFGRTRHDGCQRIGKHPARVGLNFSG